MRSILSIALVAALFASPVTAAEKFPTHLACKTTGKSPPTKTGMIIREASLWISFARRLRMYGHPKLVSRYHNCAFNLFNHFLKMGRPWAAHSMSYVLSMEQYTTPSLYQRACQAIAKARQRGVVDLVPPGCPGAKKPG